MFFELDLNREGLAKYIERKDNFPITTFRGNISKINRKLKEGLNNETLFNTFSIRNVGKRGAKFYGIKAPAEKLRIK